MQNLKLVDVHCHLQHNLYKQDLKEVIERARGAGLKAIVCSGVNPETNIEVLYLHKKYPEIIKCTFGIYPIDALGLSLNAPDEVGLTTHDGPIDLDQQFEFIKKHRDECVGVGEIGLDYHWDKENHDLQKQNLLKIIEFCEKLNKPVVIHSRNAEKDCIDMLTSSKLKKVVLHCFAGNKSLIKKAADAGFYFSIPSIIARLQHFQTVVGMVNLSQLLTETDAPWLSPFAGLNQRNEPANVLHSINMIAKIKSLTVEETALNIFKNYLDVFE